MGGYVSSKSLGDVDKKMSIMNKKQKHHEEKDEEKFKKIGGKKKKKKKMYREDIMHV